MLNLFKKYFNKKIKPKEPKETATKKEKTQPFVLPDSKQNLQALYECSVQKTVKDFQIQTVNMNGARVNVAMDSLEALDIKGLQSAYEPNIMGQEIIFTHFAKQSFIGFNNCAILAQDWLINKAICAPCEDAIAFDYDITLKDIDITTEDKDVINKLKNLSEDKTRFNIKDICKTFAQNKRKYGQALCIPLIERVDYSLPFNIDAIRPKAYKGITCIEPIWVAPVLDMEATTNPLSKRFYKPTWFRLPNGQLIHHTWFIFNIYGELSDILKPTYYFGGLPLPQLLYEQVYAADKTAKEAPMLAQSKRLNYIEGNLNAFIADNIKLSNTLKIMSWLRNNWGWLLIKKDQKIGQLDTTLTDFDAVTMLGYQIVSAISCVPSARLLETSPKGWQSTGSFESESYKQLQQGIQRLDYVPILDFHYKLLAKSEFDINKNYSCVFSEIDTPTEKERAEIREINSRTDSNYINSGVIAPDEVRTILREDVNSGYNALSEEMEQSEEDPFADIINNGGNSDAPDPFSTDEFKESDHPRDNDGKFSSSGSTSGENKNSVEKSINYDKVKNRQRKPIHLPKEEYGLVVHNLNNNLSKDERKEKVIIKNINNHRYTVVNKGFNEYKIIRKEPIDNEFN